LYARGSCRFCVVEADDLRSCWPSGSGPRRPRRGRTFSGSCSPHVETPLPASCGPAFLRGPAVWDLAGQTALMSVAWPGNPALARQGVLPSAWCLIPIVAMYDASLPVGSRPQVFRLENQASGAPRAALAKPRAARSAPSTRTERWCPTQFRGDVLPSMLAMPQHARNARSDRLLISSNCGGCSAGCRLTSGPRPRSGRPLPSGPPAGGPDGSNGIEVGVGWCRSPPGQGGRSGPEIHEPQVMVIFSFFSDSAVRCHAPWPLILAIHPPSIGMVTSRRKADSQATS